MIERNPEIIFFNYFFWLGFTSFALLFIDYFGVVLAITFFNYVAVYLIIF